MTPVDGIPPVDVCTNGVAIAIRLAKNIRLMSAGVGPEDSILVDVVRICSTSTRMIWGKP